MPSLKNEVSVMEDMERTSGERLKVKGSMLLLDRKGKGSGCSRVLWQWQVGSGQVLVRGQRCGELPL